MTVSTVSVGPDSMRLFTGEAAMDLFRLAPRLMSLIGVLRIIENTP